MPSYTSNNADDAFKSYMARLLKSSSHADLTIRSGSYEIKAHKNIVSQCGFFAGACRKDGAFLEAQTGVISMPSDEPCALTAMIEFLYTATYTLNPALPALLTHAKVYAIADKYCLPHLQDLATSYFLVTADQLNTSGLSNTSCSVAQGRAEQEALRLDFLDAVQYLYTETPSPSLDDLDYASETPVPLPLQAHAVSIAKHHAEAFFRPASAGAAVYSSAKQLLHDYPEFAVDMALATYTLATGRSNGGTPEVKSMVPTLAPRTSSAGSLDSPPTHASTHNPTHIRTRSQPSTMMIDRFAVLWT